jgi:hypothetical protein
MSLSVRAAVRVMEQTVRISMEPALAEDGGAHAVKMAHLETLFSPSGVATGKERNPTPASDG